MTGATTRLQPSGPFDRSGLHHANRLPMHSLRRESELGLDGEWDFQLLGDDHQTVSESWTPVQVPSLWTMTSEIDPPHYTNVPMPFDDVYPTIPARNPVGIYRRSFEISTNASRRTILHVGAAEGLLRVALNSRPIGTSGDSHLAAEFDITDELVDGRNVLELTVAKWSSATYLEDQDQWWHSGISRSVYLYTVPDVRIADVAVVADFDAASSLGALDVVVETSGLRHRYQVDHEIRVRVLGNEHQVSVAPRVVAATIPKPSKDRSTRPPQRYPEDFMDLVSMTAADAPIAPEFRANPELTGATPTLSASAAPAGTARLTLTALDVSAWSAERPALYDLAIELVDSDGRVVDAVSQRIGFRRVAIVGRDLLVNGARILIQGVNRHDFDPQTGRVMSRDRMLEELSLLKRFNFNAIRTSHYPNDPIFLDLCDEVGFYVVDEADIEGHAFASTIANDPIYLPEIVERVSRMVLRDRNHASVIVWSLGNETGYGAAHDAAAAWVRHFDPSRPVQYEGAVSPDWYAGRAASDIVCPMYAAFATLEAYSADPRGDRPLILCEYAYSQGNSTGGFDRYWELFESLPGVQGGFIWEFKDHALDPEGDGRFRFGGDFGDEPNSGVVLLNGIVAADLKPRPALYEIRGIFSPLRVVSGHELALQGRVRVRNRQTFADLSGMTLQARVDTRHGDGISSDLPTPDIAAGSEVTIELPIEISRALRNPEAIGLTLFVRTRFETIWASAGTELAALQVALPSSADRLPVEGTAPALGSSGAIEHPLLERAPKLCLWRALTDNDISFPLDQRFVRSGYFSLTLSAPAEIQTSANQTTVVYRYAGAFGDEVVHRRTIRAVGDGDYVFDEAVDLPEGTRDGLRVGMEFELAEGFDDVEWLGLGPWENYPDRRSAARLGRWAASIEELAVEYVRPQENGTRGGVTELVVSGGAGRVEVSTEVPAHINVGRYTLDELESADHWWELPASRATVVHVDIAHRGVGTGRIGPDTRPLYRLSGSHYEWRWRLSLAGTR